MNINLYLENTLAVELTQYAEHAHKPRNAIIREAIKEWLNHHQKKAWSKSILNFKGCADFPAFESYRNELKPPKEDPFE